MCFDNDSCVFFRKCTYSQIVHDMSFVIWCTIYVTSGYRVINDGSNDNNDTNCNDG